MARPSRHGPPSRYRGEASRPLGQCQVGSWPREDWAEDPGWDERARHGLDAAEQTLNPKVELEGWPHKRLGTALFRLPNAAPKVTAGSS
jgi:hypothetical protein